MTRVSSFGQNQALLQGILRNQDQLFEAQKQVNTGKISDEYRGLGNQTSALVAGKSLSARTEAYQDVAQDISRTTSVYDVQLSFILENAGELRSQMMTAIGNNDGVGFDIILDESFGMALNSLNTKVGNRFVFGGAATTSTPVTVSSLDELQALPSVADAFGNTPIRSVARVADSVEIDYGILADEIGSDLMQVFKDLADFNDGPSGPISGEMTAEQSDFLRAKIADLDNAIATVTQAQMRNGVHQSQLEDILKEHSDQQVFLATFIADIEDVDIAEAISRLNNTQTALEASYRVVAQTAQLSIVNFL